MRRIAAFPLINATDLSMGTFVSLYGENGTSFRARGVSNGNNGYGLKCANTAEKAMSMTWWSVHPAIRIRKILQQLVSAIIVIFGAVCFCHAGNVIIEPTSNDYKYMYNFNWKAEDALPEYVFVTKFTLPDGLMGSLECNAKPEGISLQLNGNDHNGFSVTELSSCVVTIINKSDKSVYVNMVPFLSIGNGNIIPTAIFYLNGTIPSDIKCSISAPTSIELGDISRVRDKKNISNTVTANVGYDCGGGDAFINVSTNNNIQNGCVSSGKGVMYCLKINDNNLNLEEAGIKTLVNNGNVTLSVTPEAYSEPEVGEHNAAVNIRISVN